jgi:hypothetical protein
MTRPHQSPECHCEACKQWDAVRCYLEAVYGEAVRRTNPLQLGNASFPLPRPLT